MADYDEDAVLAAIARVTPLIDELQLLIAGLEGRVKALEHGGSGGSWEPVSYEVTLDDGSVRRFIRG